jgi:hypothetical protein
MRREEKMRDTGNGWKRGADRPTIIWGGLLVLGLVLVLAAACDGGGSNNSSPTPQVTGAASPIASPGVAIAAPCQALIDAKTYRYVSTVTLDSPETTETPSEDLPLPSPTLTRPFTGPFLFEYTTEAAVVAPDRAAYSLTTSGSEPIGAVLIGQEIWVQFGEEWRASAEPLSIPYQAIPICNAILPELDLSQAEPESEDIDGTKTRHYSFARNASPEGVGKVFGVGSDMDLLISTLDVDLWLSEDDDALVRLEAQGKGLYSDGRPLMARVVLDVRDINDEDIKVVAPI